MKSEGKRSLDFSLFDLIVSSGEIFNEAKRLLLSFKQEFVSSFRPTLRSSVIDFKDHRLTISEIEVAKTTTTR